MLSRTIQANIAFGYVEEMRRTSLGELKSGNPCERREHELLSTTQESRPRQIIMCSKNGQNLKHLEVLVLWIIRIKQSTFLEQ